MDPDKQRPHRRRSAITLAAVMSLTCKASTDHLSQPGGKTVSNTLPMPVTILDTHTHFYDTARPHPPGRDRPVPWPPPSEGPVLYRPVLPAEYVKMVAPLGFKGTVVVEASEWLEDNQWLLDLAVRNPVIVGIVGN